MAKDSAHKDCQSPAGPTIQLAGDRRCLPEFPELNLSQTPWALALPSSAEMAQLDSAAISAGIPALELMERAGQACAKHVCVMLGEAIPRSKSVLVLCGPGNNGGDGAVIARILHERGISVRVMLVAAVKLSPQLQTNLDRLVSLGVNLRLFSSSGGNSVTVPGLPIVNDHELVISLSESVLIVDALLGTGQSGPPRGELALLIELVIQHQKNGKVPVLSVDCPTGVNTTSGEVYIPALSADRTIAIEVIKRGLVQSPAFEHCGEIFAESIGIDCSRGAECSLLSSRTLALPPRPRTAHKGMMGRVWILAGSTHMPGAALLSARGALHSGAGLVCMLPGALASAEAAAVPETILLPVPTVENSGADAWRALAPLLKDAQGVVLGPGLGLSPQSREFIRLALEALAQSQVPYVVDADALTCCAELHLRAGQFGAAVLTPHPGEAARLLGITTLEVQRDRYAAARQLSQLLDVVVVLKGASTVIAGRDSGFVNLHGNPYMAVAGSGDVLSGILGTFVAQGHSPLKGAKLAVYVHARAGELAHQRSGGPILASEIAVAASAAVGELVEISEAG